MGRQETVNQDDGQIKAHACECLTFGRCHGHHPVLIHHTNDPHRFDRHHHQHTSHNNTRPTSTDCTFIYLVVTMTTPQIEKILTENSPKKLLLYLRTTATDSLARIPQSDPLEQLNPAVHSLGYLFILYSVVRTVS